jgi:hypothetical protein
MDPYVYASLNIITEAIRVLIRHPSHHLLQAPYRPLMFPDHPLILHLLHLLFLRRNQPSKSRMSLQLLLTSSQRMSIRQLQSTSYQRRTNTSQSTPQLVTCLTLMQVAPAPGEIMDTTTRTWLQAIEKDTDEQERLTVMATDVVRAFKRDELKDAKAVAEVVSLTPVLDKDTFRDLLSEFYTGVNQSGLLDHHSLEGLAQLVQGADPGYLDADDLVKILQLLSTRLKETHGQSLNHKYLLTLTVSHVLDAMADTSVKNLDS